MLANPASQFDSAIFLHYTMTIAELEDNKKNRAVELKTALSNYIVALQDIAAKLVSTGYYDKAKPVIGRLEQLEEQYRTL